MGFRTGARLQIRANFHSTSRKCTRSNTSIERKGTIAWKSIQVARERGNIRANHTHSKKLNLKDVPQSQEGEHNEINNQPEGNKKLHPPRTLQDGRPQGLLLCNLNRPHPQKISCIPVLRHHVPVQPFTVWPHISPESVHEDNEAHHGMAKAVGLLND